jgi:hypothetical protein
MVGSDLLLRRQLKDLVDVGPSGMADSDGTQCGLESLVAGVAAQTMARLPEEFCAISRLASGEIGLVKKPTKFILST